MYEGFVSFFTSTDKKALTLVYSRHVIYTMKEIL